MKQTATLLTFCIFTLNIFAQTKSTRVELTTDFGVIKIKLYDETPKHKENFIKLVKEGYFDGTLFHRVIKNFMIQGGDPNSKTAKDGEMLGNGGPAYTIPAEFNSKLFHKKGALAAARQGDNVNPKKESSGSQFYIVQGKVYSIVELNNMAAKMGVTFSKEQIEAYTTVGGTPFLDGGYTVFGEVTEGLDVVDKIAAVEKDKFDRPLKNIAMKIKLIEE